MLEGEGITALDWWTGGVGTVAAIATSWAAVAAWRSANAARSTAQLLRQERERRR